MDSSSTMICYFLAFSFAVVQADGNFKVITTTPVLNLTHTTSNETYLNSTDHVPTFSGTTTGFPTTTQNNDTLSNTTAAITESTQSTNTTSSLTQHTSVMTETPATDTPTVTALTTTTQHTTGGYISTPDTAAVTTAKSEQTGNTTQDSESDGIGLNNTELNMTILFSVVLGVFAMALVLFMFNKCKHRVQYLHQPLTNTDATDAFEADDDTLVISGGLYDGHPIYDNVPTVTEEPSQFRLEFIH